MQVLVWNPTWEVPEERADPKEGEQSSGRQPRRGARGLKPPYRKALNVHVKD